jgi:hypothetical protein
MKLLSIFFALFIAFSSIGFSQTLFVQSIKPSTTPFVGIGISDPSYDFHINSTTNGWSSVVQNQGCFVYSAYGNGTTDGWGMQIRVNNSRNDRYSLKVYNGVKDLLYVRNDGNIGIGTSSPAAKMHIETSSGLLGLYINHQATINDTWGMKINVNRDLTKAFIISNSLSGNDVFHIKGNGQVYGNGFNTTTGSFSAQNIGSYGYGVSVGVTDDQAKAYSLTNKNGIEVFYVWGNGIVNAKKIYAEAFEVRPDAFGINWFDNVFFSNYELKPLCEVEQYVNENGHLPDIPSEKEVKTNGYNIVQMDGLLLKKIEELTLYVIQQQKEIEHLKKSNNN